MPFHLDKLHLQFNRCHSIPFHFELLHINIPTIYLFFFSFYLFINTINGGKRDNPQPNATIKCVIIQFEFSRFIPFKECSVIAAATLPKLWHWCSYFGCFFMLVQCALLLTIYARNFICQYGNFRLFVHFLKRFSCAQHDSMRVRERVKE